jgi:hypothetical protein
MQRTIFTLSWVLLLASPALAQNLNKGSKAFTFNGSAAVGASYYDVTGLANRQNPYGYFLSINATPTIYEVSLPFSITLNEQGSRFGQPFNRFGMSPTYKWAKLHLGHRNLNFSEFTLNGITVFGVGFELNPGKFRMAGIYGRFREAVTDPNGNLNFFRPQFERIGYSGKIGVGTENNFVDLIFFRADDDTNSINLSDTLSRGIEAANNTSVGLKSQFRMFKKHLVFSLDAATSLYTRDIRSTQVGLEDLPLPSLVDYLQPNLSSNVAVAGKTSLELDFKHWGLGVQYRLVQDQYRSLGTNYLIDDLEQYTINPRLNLFKNKLNISGSYGLQFNNLANRRAFGTNRNIGSIAVNWLASQKFSLSGSYSNFAIFQNVVRDQIFNDSLVIDQINHNVSLTPVFAWGDENTFNSLNLNANYQRLQDNNDFTAGFNENYLINNSLGYTLSLPKTFWSFSVGANHNIFETETLNSSRYGGFLAANKSLLKQKLSVGASFNYNRNVQVGNNSNIYNAGFNANYQLAKKQSLNLNAFWLGTRGDEEFTEMRFSFGYRVGF